MDPSARSEKRSLIGVESPDEGSIDISEYLSKEFDYTIKHDLYKHEDPFLVYDLMRKIVVDEDNKLARPIFVMAPDVGISSATIAGHLERHSVATPVTNEIRGQSVPGVEYTSDMKILYISARLGMMTSECKYLEQLASCTVTNAMGVMSKSFTNHNVNLDPKNIIYVGIQDDLIHPEEQTFLDELGPNRPQIFTYEQIKEKGIERIMRYVSTLLTSRKVHVVLDVCALTLELAPSSYRHMTDKYDLSRDCPDGDLSKIVHGFDRDELAIIMRTVNDIKSKDNLIGMDLMGYRYGHKDNKDNAHESNMLTTKTIMQIFGDVADFTTHSINVFNKDSKFLIWKKIPDPSIIAEDDPQHIWQTDPISWYILRDMDLQTRSLLIEHFDKNKAIMNRLEADVKAKEEADKGEDGEDVKNNEDAAADETKYEQYVEEKLEQMRYPIEMFEFPDDAGDVMSVMISVTTPAEQELKAADIASSYTDRCLAPGEKVNMMFEMLSTPQSIETFNKEAERANADGTSLLLDNLTSEELQEIREMGRMQVDYDADIDDQNTSATKIEVRSSKGSELEEPIKTIRTRKTTIAAER